MHTKVAIVLIERLQCGDIWHIFDHLVDPLDALDHLVSTKIDFSANYYLIDGLQQKPLHTRKKKPYQWSTLLIMTKALSQMKTRELESWLDIVRRALMINSQYIVDWPRVIWIRLEATWVEILPDFALSSLVNNFPIMWLNFFFQVWFATCYQYPQ